MPSITKPLIPLSPLPKNELGLTIRDYEGQMSTLCAGCGHDSVTAAIVHAFWETLDAAAHDRQAQWDRVLVQDHRPTSCARARLNSAHGRMVPIATGAIAANRELTISHSGDGDSLSIGLGHLMHGIRRNVKMVYIIENNGVYGLTKGQMSASATSARDRRRVRRMCSRRSIR